MDQFCRWNVDIYPSNLIRTEFKLLVKQFAMYDVKYIPSDIALTKIVKARMKIIKDARPRMAIILLTTCCPVKAAIVATATK